MNKTVETLPQPKTLADSGPQVVIRANYELFVLALTVMQVFNAILIATVRDGEMERIPGFVIIGISIFLLGDFFYRLYASRDRRRFFFSFHGYLLLIGSLPLFFAVARLIWYRLITAKLQRADYIDMERIVVRKRAQSAMLGVIFAAVIVLQTSSFLILRAEAHADQALITTADDALWWALVTMATVGYGDMVPVTASGRLVALFAMIIGVGLFTVLTSFLAQSFLRSSRGGDRDRSLKDMNDISDAQGAVDAIRQLLDQQESNQQTAMSELRGRLDQLEQELTVPKREK